jgi:hypothetical protein
MGYFIRLHIVVVVVVVVVVIGEIGLTRERKRENRRG